MKCFVMLTSEVQIKLFLIKLCFFELDLFYFSIRNPDGKDYVLENPTALVYLLFNRAKFN